MALIYIGTASFVLVDDTIASVVACLRILSNIAFKGENIEMDGSLSFLLASRQVDNSPVLESQMLRHDTNNSLSPLTRF